MTAPPPHCTHAKNSLFLSYALLSPEALVSTTYPVTGPPPASPSVQWMVSADEVLVMDMSMGEPGEPAVSDAQLPSVRLKGNTAVVQQRSYGTSTFSSNPNL